MPNEVSVHAQEYDLAGTLFEDESFGTDDEEEDIKPEWDVGNRESGQNQTLTRFRKVTEDLHGCLDQTLGLTWKLGKESLQAGGQADLRHFISQEKFLGEEIGTVSIKKRNLFQDGAVKTNLSLEGTD